LPEVVAQTEVGGEEGGKERLLLLVLVRRKEGEASSSPSNSFLTLVTCRPKGRIVAGKKKKEVGAGPFYGREEKGSSRFYIAAGREREGETMNSMVPLSLLPERRTEFFSVHRRTIQERKQS